MVFFNFWIFFLFFWNFLFQVGKERNGAIIFIFSLSQHFPTYFGLGWIRNGIFQFFRYFFEIFSSPSGRNESEWWFFFSLCLCLFHPIWVWNEAVMVFFNFLNIFAIFMKFSLILREGTKQNDNFYFLSFSAFSILFGLEMKP